MFDIFATSCTISHATLSPFTGSKTYTCSFRHMKEHILFHYKLYVTMKQTDLILNNPATTDEKFNNLILQGSFRLCNWLSLRRLVSWINHLPPACWSTFCCRFDILDSISSFFCILTYAIIYVLLHHIIFWLYLYFLNILYFFKYSCTNIFHSRSLCTFYFYW